VKDGQVKVTDFGFAKNNITQKMVMKSYVGSPLYMSPQMLEKEPYSSKSDVWAFGIIFYELLYKHTPWKADSSKGLLRKIK
jgi:serine/threonine protein kinase